MLNILQNIKYLTKQCEFMQCSKNGILWNNFIKLFNELRHW